MIENLVIVGVGLIGGSIGLAVKERGLARHVRGLGRSLDSLRRARDLGVIDSCHTDPREACAAADFIVLCTPVDQIALQALAYAPLCPPGAILTDAGSTKARLVADIESALPSHAYFVGSHPLAGSEKRGPEFADARLFVDRWTVVTPTPRSNADAVERVKAFWIGLSSKVRTMNPQDHDRALALTSHLPHLLASALAGIVSPDLLPLTAGGFRDTTRIAAGDPGLWTAIFRQNDGAVLDSLALLEARCAEFRRAIEDDDAPRLETLLRDGKTLRDRLR